MNYEANTIHHEIGALVLHDADAKRKEMLMEVMSYTRLGHCRTRYIHPKPGWRGTFVNHISVLHDPARFGITPLPVITEEV